MRIVKTMLRLHQNYNLKETIYNFNSHDENTFRFTLTTYLLPSRSDSENSHPVPRTCLDLNGVKNTRIQWYSLLRTQECIYRHGLINFYINFIRNYYDLTYVYTIYLNVIGTVSDNGNVTGV